MRMQWLMPRLLPFVDKGCLMTWGEGRRGTGFGYGGIARLPMRRRHGTKPLLCRLRVCAGWIL